ncbi:MAG: DM13 domain-containing protein [Pseudomonadota bacterium]
MFKLLRIIASHGIALAIGFALGIYLLPILTAPEPPSDTEVAASAARASYTGEFVKDLPGSDLLHWGEGTIALAEDQISFSGAMSPGPDYKLYLTPELVTTEEEFLAVKNSSARVGDVKTFDNFILTIPEGISLEDYRAVVIWCETFGEFITASTYR